MSGANNDQPTRAGLAAGIAGVLFGAGLALSGMTNPEKVLAFLTLGPDWDPTLIGVMGSALIVTAIGYALIDRREQPLFTADFARPPGQPINGALLGGATLFGLGWGLTGYCPGPAIVGSLTFSPRAAVFLLAVIIGMLLLDNIRSAAASSQGTAGATDG
ncbi:MAG: DUF6691 family protein [Pseudomonadota bacterium]